MPGNEAILCQLAGIGKGVGGMLAGAGVYLLTVSSRFSSGFPFNNILLFCLPPSTALIMILVLITCLPSGFAGSFQVSPLQHGSILVLQKLH